MFYVVRIIEYFSKCVKSGQLSAHSPWPLQIWYYSNFKFIYNSVQYSVTAQWFNGCGYMFEFTLLYNRNLDEWFHEEKRKHRSWYFGSANLIAIHQTVIKCLYSQKKQSRNECFCIACNPDIFLYQSVYISSKFRIAFKNVNKWLRSSTKPRIPVGPWSSTGVSRERVIIANRLLRYHVPTLREVRHFSVFRVTLSAGRLQRV